VRRTLLACCGLFLLTDVQATPLEVYGRLPTLEAVALSPDGSRLAYVRTEGNVRVVAMVSLPAREPLGAIKLGAERLRTIQWADNTHLLIGTSMVYTSVVGARMSAIQGPHLKQATPPGASGAGGTAGSGAPAGIGSPIISVGHPVTVTRDWSLLQVYDLNAHTATAIPDPSKLKNLTLMNAVTGEPMVRTLDGHSVLFVPGIYLAEPGMGEQYDESDMMLPALIRVDLDTGSQTVLRQGSKSTQLWLTDSAGEVVAEQDYYESSLTGAKRWALKIDRSGRLEEAISGREASDYPRLLGFGPAPDTLLVQTIERRDAVWKPMSLKDGTFGPSLAEGRALGTPIEEPLTYRTIGGVQVQDDLHYIFFDPAQQGHWDALVRGFGAAHVQLASMSQDFTKVAVRVESPEFGFKYALVDFATHKADPIGDVYAGLAHPLEVQRITYTASDGLQIPGYLTLPRDHAAKGLALIVLPHSAASGLDTADFDWWSQALADQGYAVLRPNFRGSNVSHEFMAAGYGQWGRKMQTDLSDGVHYLVQQGIVDPKRVCIVGAGYGGYAALAGVTLDPGVYRCAVAVDGVSDLGRWQKWTLDSKVDPANVEQLGWDRVMAATGPSDSTLSGLSPLKHVDAVQAPVLLIHGQDDAVVPFEQSEAMYEALRRAGKPVDLVRLPRDDHLLSSGESRLLMLQKSVEFLRVNDPPG
jgi:dipeptidyl aminopeptidase/acylaminoacyl peptidase